VSAVAQHTFALAACSAPIENLIQKMLDLTITRSTTAMPVHAAVCVAAMQMYWTEIPRAEVIGPRSTEFSLKG
jgi:hypothetical protein